MKLTKSQIKQIIKEELEAVMMEMEDEQLEEKEEEVLEQKGGLKYDEAAAVAELQAKMAEPMTRSRKSEN